MAHTELASAVFLIIESIFFDDFHTSFAESALTPVLVPPDYIFVWLNGILPCPVYLFKTFPSGRGKRCRDYSDAVLVSISRSTSQSDFETFHTAVSPFRFIFKSLYHFEPLFMVVFVFNYFQS